MAEKEVDNFCINCDQYKTDGDCKIDKDFDQSEKLN